jgi:hypothetical protein
MTTDRILECLFSLARRPPENRPIEMPFGLETAILAHWRESFHQRALGTGLLRGLRWAALTACVIALLMSALASDELSAFSNRFDPEARVADSAIVAGYGYE